jgi:DNA modification methylase
VKLLPTFTERGDISPLLNRIHHCDALALLRRLPDASVDMILTSPPYDSLRLYKGFTWDFEAIAKESFRVLKHGGVLVWVVGDAVVNGSETLSSFRQALYFVDTCGFRMHDTMIYNKDGVTFPDTTRYHQCFEYMFVLSKNAPKVVNLLMERPNKYAGQKISKTQREPDGRLIDGISKRLGRRNADVGVYTNLWEIHSGFMKSTSDTEAFEHPAIFPEELARRHIATWSNPGDIVLDYFSGSGTTAKMARNLNRQFIGCDISEEYVNLARLRLSNTDAFQNTVFKDGSVQLSLFAS